MNLRQYYEETTKQENELIETRKKIGRTNYFIS